MIRAALLTLAIALPAAAQTPAIEGPAGASSTGHFRLQWRLDGGGEFELVEATAPDFGDVRTVYAGPDRATSVSGKTDGTYWYRVRADGGPWSEPIRVEVRHHDRSRALLFLGLGAGVFLATAILIAAGHLAHVREAARDGS